MAEPKLITEDMPLRTSKPSPRPKMVTEELPAHCPQCGLVMSRNVHGVEICPKGHRR